MRQIKLLIQKEEDLVLLEQGLNWIRQHCIKSTKDIFELIEKLPKKHKNIFNKTIDARVDTYDRLMSLIAQLDKEIEKK